MELPLAGARSLTSCGLVPAAGGVRVTEVELTGMQPMSMAFSADVGHRRNRSGRCRRFEARVTRQARPVARSSLRWGRHRFAEETGQLSYGILEESPQNVIL